MQQLHQFLRRHLLEINLGDNLDAVVRPLL